MTKTTISDLPVDLLREIVCRVPLKSMRAVRLTCKSWDTLSKSGIFRKMNMCNEAAREEGESRMVAIMDFNLHLISVVVADVDHLSTELKGKLSCLSLDSDQQQEVKIIRLFHCDGLLLCVLKDSFKLVVWNPYLGQTRWIEPPSYSYRAPDGWDRYRYALGYDNKKKSHKILRFMDDNIPSHELFLRYEIYDFDSNLWRTLDVGTPHWFISFYTTGVPLNGNTYWLAEHMNSDCDGSDCLICFDFTSERFGPILPLPFPSEEDRRVIGVLYCFKGEKLALFLQFERPVELEVWVTTMIDPNKVSWSKFLKVDTGPAAGIFFSYADFFIDEEKKVAMVFDISSDTRHTLNIIGEAGFFRQVDVDLLIERVRFRPHEYDHAHVCSYVPSLVQVQIKKPPLRVFKRKQRSKLEIRPCQQNKSRLDEEDSAKRTRPT